MAVETIQENIRAWFNEFEAHLLRDEAPSAYFLVLLAEGRFPKAYPFSMIERLKSVPQQPVHHPEGDVLTHTLQVTDLAAQHRQQSEEPRAFMWAALLHDLGKIPTTKVRSGRITAYDHDKEGEKLARDFLQQCTDDEAFIARVCALVRWHMQVLFVAHRLPFADIRSMLRSVSPKEIALLTFCDRLGRGPLKKEAVEEEENNIRLFLENCAALHKRGQ